jgi:putative spermidine/putrescine transport system permease protein
MYVLAAKTVRPSAWLAAPVLAFLAAAYVVPGLLIVLLAAGHPPRFSVDPQLLGLSVFARVFDSSYYLKVLWETIALSVTVGVVAAIFGYPVAYFLVRSRSRWRNALFYFTLIPMAVGMNMITLGWLIVLGRHGLINSFLQWTGITGQPLELLYTWGSLVIGLTNVLFTFMVLPIATVLKNIDPAVEAAARNLGAGPMQTFLRVTLPLSLEGVAAGFLVVFMLAAGALVMPMLLGGSRNPILPVLIWEQFTVANDRNLAAALALVLLAVALVVLVVQQRFLQRGTVRT